MRRALVLSCCMMFSSACDKAKAPDGATPADKAPSDAKGEAKAGDAATPEVAKADPAPAGSRPQDSAEAAAVGKPAPDFELVDLEGKTHHLSDYAGKTVVLEWFNPECPFVQYAHTKGPLQTMAKDETAKGVVWLAVNSGAANMQGFEPAKNKEMVETFAMAHPVLRDPDGVVGHLYGAVKTPHMFLIDDKGTLQYAGGIDNAPFGEVDGDGPRVGYLDEALAALRSGKPVATAEAKAWGCTVKYAKG
ncbi:MAG: redoxin domain-containing protein [Myxococcota bacterium]